MSSKALLLVIAGAIAYLAWQFGGVRTGDWAPAFLAVAVATIAWASTRGQFTSRLPEARVTIPMLLLIAYVFLQTVPIPLSVLGMISPARHELANGLAPVFAIPESTPLSVDPAATWLHLAKLSAYLLTFFGVYAATRRSRTQAWQPLFLLLGVITAEALTGLTQAVDWDQMSRGTYVNRNHFAGLMELGLPLGIAWLWQAKADFDIWRLGPRIAVKVISAVGMTTLIGTALLIANSRMALFASCAAAILVLFLLIRRRSAWIGAALSAACVSTIAWMLTGLPGLDSRLQVWSDSARVAASYLWTGCGLGALESGLYPLRQSAPLLRYDYAHNDYLQALAELGLVGVLLAGVSLATILRRLYQFVGDARGPARIAAIGCLGSITAFLIHALTDFNFYIPANAMAFSWCCGASLALTKREQDDDDSSRV